MITVYISLLAALIVSVFAIVIQSITSSSQIWKTTILTRWSPYWGSKDLTSGKKWSNELTDGQFRRKEAFPFSSTLLVWITDAWHLSVILSYIGSGIAGYLAAYIWITQPNFETFWYLSNIWIITYGVVFNYSYHYGLVKKEYKKAKALPKWQEVLGKATILVVALSNALLLQHGIISTGWGFLYIFAPITIIIAVLAIKNAGGFLLNLLIKVLKNDRKRNKN